MKKIKDPDSAIKRIQILNQKGNYMDIEQFHQNEYNEFLEEIEIAATAMKESLLYPTEEILFDLYAIPSHNHQAYYGVIVEKSGLYEMIYAKTEIRYIQLDEPIRMYTFSDAKEANASSDKVGKIIVGIAKIDSEFVEVLKDIDDSVSDGRYFFKSGVMLDGVFQAIRTFESGKLSKEIIYENIDDINLSQNKEYLREKMENMYLEVESIIEK